MIILLLQATETIINRMNHLSDNIFKIIINMFNKDVKIIKINRSPISPKEYHFQF